MLDHRLGRWRGRSHPGPGTGAGHKTGQGETWASSPPPADEARLLGKETIEEARFLLNANMDSKNPVVLILSGQNEPWDKLVPCHTEIFG